MVWVAYSERVTEPKLPFSNSRRKREALVASPSSLPLPLSPEVAALRRVPNAAASLRCAWPWAPAASEPGSAWRAASLSSPSPSVQAHRMGPPHWSSSGEVACRGGGGAARAFPLSLSPVVADHGAHGARCPVLWPLMVLSGGEGGPPRSLLSAGRAGRGWAPWGLRSGRARAQGGRDGIKQSPAALDAGGGGGHAAHARAPSRGCVAGSGLGGEREEEEGAGAWASSDAEACAGGFA